MSNRTIPLHSGEFVNVLVATMNEDGRVPLVDARVDRVMLAAGHEPTAELFEHGSYPSLFMTAHDFDRALSVGEGTFDMLDLRIGDIRYRLLPAL